MNFYEKFGISKDLPHNQKYDAIIDNLGYEYVKMFLPVSKETIKEALKTDEHLNNIPLKLWDAKTGLNTYIDRKDKTQKVIFLEDGLTNLCRDKGVNCYSQADLVCILKRCAVRYANE